MDEIYVYCVPLPGCIREAVTPCADGYTVYIREDLSIDQKLEALAHAMRHINGDDFEKADVQEIEANAHEEGRDGEGNQEEGE